MASTLEKLLSIQAYDPSNGKPLSEATEGPQEREEARSGIPPPPLPTGPTEGPAGANRGIDAPPPGKPSPDMLEAWREAFRIFSRYAPAIRDAVATDGEQNERSCSLFSEALRRVMVMAAPGGDAQIVAVRVYDMLGDVWKEARKGCENHKQERN